MTEPTLHDVMAVLVGLDTRMKKGFESVDKRFESVDKRFETISGRIDNIDERLGGVEHRLGAVEVVVLDIREELTSGLAAFDEDAKKIIDHERRIKRLEKSRA